MAQMSKEDYDEAVEFVKEDECPQDVFKIMALFEKKYGKKLKKKYPKQNTDEWAEDEEERKLKEQKEAAEKGDGDDDEDDDLFDYYAIETKKTVVEKNPFPSRAERLQIMFDSFKDKNPIIKEKKLHMADAFPNTKLSDLQNKDKFKHVNDFYEAKNSDDLKKFIKLQLDETWRERKKKVIIVTYDKEFSEGIRNIVKDEFGYPTSGLIDDVKNHMVVVCGIDEVRYGWRSFPVPDLMINMNLTPEIAWYLNRMLMARVIEDNEKVHTTLIHAGSSLVQEIEKYFTDGDA